MQFGVLHLTRCPLHLVMHEVLLLLARRVIAAAFAWVATGYYTGVAIGCNLAS